MQRPNWRTLFLEARRMLDEEEWRHADRCGCRDGDGEFDDGKPCPGVKERVEFLKKTAKLARGAKR